MGGVDSRLRYGRHDVAVDVVVLHAEIGERRARNASSLLQEAKENVLRADGIDLELLTLLDRAGHHVLEMWRAGEPPEYPRFLEAFLDEPVDFSSELFLRDAALAENGGAEPGSLGSNGKKQMLGSDVFLVVLPGDSVGDLDHLRDSCTRPRKHGL